MRHMVSGVCGCIFKMLLRANTCAAWPKAQVKPMLARNISKFLFISGRYSFSYQGLWQRAIDVSPIAARINMRARSLGVGHGEGLRMRRSKCFECLTFWFGFDKRVSGKIKFSYECGSMRTLRKNLYEQRMLNVWIVSFEKSKRE